jgi:hypothetical protein
MSLPLTALLPTLDPSALLAWTPFLEPLPGASRVWWLFLLPLSFLLSMAWKAVRLPKLDHYWRDVFSMTGQIIAAVVALAIGLYILVQVVMPMLPVD